MNDSQLRDEPDDRGESTNQQGSGEDAPATTEGAEVTFAIEGDVEMDAPIADPRRHRQGTAWTASGSIG